MRAWREASANPLLHELYVSFGSVFHNDLLRQQRRGGFNGLPHEGHDELVAAIAARDGRPPSKASPGT